MLRDAEIKIDNVIDYGINLYTARKQTFFICLVVSCIMFLPRIIGYIDSEILRPINVAMQKGISSVTMAHAVSLGICSGLSAPGFTMIFLIIISQFLHFINIHLEPSALAISAAINAALVVPDVYIWKTVFASVGSRFVGGGRYIRPFFGGVVPWALSVPILYIFIFYLVDFLSVLVVLSM